MAKVELVILPENFRDQVFVHSRHAAMGLFCHNKHKILAALDLNYYLIRQDTGLVMQYLAKYKTWLFSLLLFFFEIKYYKLFGQLSMQADCLVVFYSMSN